MGKRVKLALWGLAGLAASGGIGSLLWASNRQYADLQRSYAYITGMLGVGGAVVLLLVAACVGLRARRDDD